jgi:heme exporter protein C
MWFGMIIILAISFYHSILYLRKGLIKHDLMALSAARTGIIFGILGLTTGMIWSTYTWGEPWSYDPKQNASAVAMLIYAAYIVLRGSLKDEEKRARIGAVYNIFAFFMLIPLLFILPRLTDSLHPGNGGNPGFNAYDLDAQLRLVFYPAVLAWFLLGWWITLLLYRVASVKQAIIELEFEKTEQPV